MPKTMLNRIWILVAFVLILAACGRKEAPQIVHDNQPPQLVDLRHELRGMVIKLDFKLTGSTEGVGYQVDRAEMDPYCQCPGKWRRYREELASPNNIGKPLTKMLKLRSQNIEYIFRLRAFDAAGQLGPWSEFIHARGVDLFNQ